MRIARYCLQGVLTLSLFPACGQPGDLSRKEATGWPRHGQNHAEQRFSALEQINDGTVHRLGLLWSLEMQTSRGLEATPILADGILYTTGSWSVVVAVDARTGKPIWNWDPKVPRQYGYRACCDVVNRGVAVEQGKVYVGTLDGRLAALDATRGDLIWEVVTVDQNLPYTITGAPRVVGENVIIGNSGAEFGVRGYLSAYDAQTGELVWRFYTVPGDPSQPFESPALETAARTWNGEWWKMGGGGTVWDSMAYDPPLNLLYVGTGNGGPWSRFIRSAGQGDNLYLCSILALRADTGELVWHYQTTPGDTWDFTSTQHIILADLEIDGRLRPVLMQAPKNGFFYVLDRISGELISAQNYVEVSWASGIDLQTGRPREVPGSDYRQGRVTVRPGPLGGHNWQPMSFNPETGLVYIPAQEFAASFVRDPDFEFRPGVRNLGVQQAGPQIDGYRPAGHLLAWDPVQQRERWRVRHAGPWNGGTLTTGGNLVFQGTSLGQFAAYRADTGERLWESWAGSGIVAAPITYQLENTQFVAVMAGWGGAYPLVGGADAAATAPPENTGRLLVFALDADRQLPGPEKRDPLFISAPTLSVSSREIERGARLFERWCDRCHGTHAVSGGILADLRYSDAAIFDLYPEIVLEGAFLARGMPRFHQWLSESEVESIRAYVASRALETAVAH